ncbi:MAG: SgcJ/EcaC family oxidoreductase [Verrucomicrobiota bacterium]
MTENEVIALFDTWNAALQTVDPKQVAALYDETDGILLPTVSNQVRHNHAEIEDYFVHFLAKKPVGTIDESNVRIFGDLAINSGVYTFAFGDGATVQARFTYVYRNNGSDWKILEHHSSAMPES